VHYCIDLAQAAACCSQAVIFGGLAEGASPGPDTFPRLHPNAVQAASRQSFAQAKSVQGANQTSLERHEGTCEGGVRDRAGQSHMHGLREFPFVRWGQSWITWIFWCRRVDVDNQYVLVII
jgi:hypothetical protein